MNDALKLAFSRIRMLILDVDGVMTDGGLYYDSQGRIMKRFNVQDGLGIKAAQAAGLEIAVITGLSSAAVESRVTELGITHYFHGHINKVPLLKRLAEDSGYGLDEMAYLGDDWVDAGPMLKVGVPMAVANAQPEIKNIARMVTEKSGGHGAVREAIMLILEARGLREEQWQKWQFDD